MIKQRAHKHGVTTQVAGAVPAMCDGITQGRAGMELSLFSRDNIAMSTAIALSHDMFDGAVYLGVCDKIVPGLLIGALSFGHLPGLFIPAGPMSSGISNKKKAEVRQQFAVGETDHETMLKTESQSYHSSGTCTFYGTANSNQVLMEIMGLQLPGSSFEHPDSAMRSALTEQAVSQLIQLVEQKNAIGIADIVDAKSIVNGMVGLLASGGSTNNTIHLVAIARAAGIILTWEDMAELSTIIPLLCRMYPNGEADVNHFHQAGGMAFFITELLDSGFLHQDVKTILGEEGLQSYAQKPQINTSIELSQITDTIQKSKPKQSIQRLEYIACEKLTLNSNVLRPVKNAFSNNGGLTLLKGNIGKAIIKTSALKSEHQIITAPARVFQTQQTLIEEFKQGKLNQNFVAVLIFQGPKSNGMPELHKLTPILGSLQDQGFKVALITDGRMSGASGKVPAAIHIVPEAMNSGVIGLIQDGDEITLDCSKNQLQLAVTEQQLSARPMATKIQLGDQQGIGRELFQVFRQSVSSADTGATVF